MLQFLLHNARVAVLALDVLHAVLIARNIFFSEKKDWISKCTHLSPQIQA